MGALLRSSGEARTLSRELRRGRGRFLRRRRRATVLGLIATGAMGMVALYQMGLIRHLPEPPFPGLDADRVDASSQAYRLLGIPDAVIGLSSYTTTMGLAAMGGADRERRHPWIPLLFAAKATADVVQAARLTVSQWRRHRAFCSWCLLAAAATVATLPQAVPEARAAWAHLRR